MFALINWRSVTASLVVLLVAVVLLLTLSSSLAHNAKPVVVPQAATVEIYPVTQQSMPQEVHALGSMQAIDKVTITSEVDGRIKSIYFKNGQQVAKGMPIVQLDDKIVQAAYNKAVSQLNVDRQKYNAQVAASSAIPQIEVDKQKAIVQQDRTDVTNAQAAIAQRQINAPFSGVLGDFQENVGDFIKAGQPVVSLVNIDELRAVYQVSQDMLSQIKVNQMVKISVDAYPKQVFYGTVDYISPTVDQNARTIAVQATVKNSKGLLRPGMFIHVAQQVSMQKKALVIPEQALLVDIKGAYVFKSINKRAVRAAVNVGTRQRGVAQINSGLRLGDQVVVAGQQKLNDGTPLQIVATLPSVAETMRRSAAAAVGGDTDTDSGDASAAKTAITPKSSAPTVSPPSSPASTSSPTVAPSAPPSAPASKAPVAVPGNKGSSGRSSKHPSTMVHPRPSPSSTSNAAGAAH